MGLPIRLFLFVLIALACFGVNANAIDSKVCGQCHAEIYRNYSRTQMARSSGLVGSPDSGVPAAGEFIDPATRTQFRIETSGKQILVHFEQEDVRGERALEYYVGAGSIGRSYSSLIDGFMFQSPVAYYSTAKLWNLSPGFEQSNRLNVTRPVEPACLNCHASRLRTVEGTVNGFQSPAFEEGGVSCERCHGDGAAHIAGIKSGNRRQPTAIVNPAKLQNAERGSVCAQCHLVGAIRIAKSDSAAAKYVPGKRFFDATSAFVWSDGADASNANSHFEQLVQSACWRRSGGNLWCGTCHDPHPAAADPNSRATSYRERCLDCHGGGKRSCSAPVAQREAAKNDCISCHMPRQPVETVQHATRVDHRIQRIPEASGNGGIPDSANLIPFPGSTTRDRELGLAYAAEALSRNNPAWGKRAIPLLGTALASGQIDPVVVNQLAQLYDRAGDENAACALYAQAAKTDAPPAAVLVNLGNCQATGGDVSSAMANWTHALQMNPGLGAARLNLAVAQYRSGEVAAARASLQAALRYDPLSARARELLVSLPEK